MTTSMAGRVMGWDIGGAHLKFAVAEPGGEVVAVQSLACPLWQGLHLLAQGVEAIDGQFDLSEGRHAITMTGELCDLFANREEGVRAIFGWFSARFPPRSLLVYGRQSGLHRIPTARALDVASMNWHASACVVASAIPDAVFVDVGSTTTDVVAIAQGHPSIRGMTDRERLASGELIYQGVVRTPVMALATKVPYRGYLQGVAAEYFATTADVFRLTGDLVEGVDLQPSADGRGKSLAESAARLARMVGDDFSPETEEPIKVLASDLASLQRERLAGAIAQLSVAPDQVLVGAGIGRFLVRQVAAETGRPYFDFAAALGIRGVLAGSASDHAAAVAVARLGLASSWQ